MIFDKPRCPICRDRGCLSCEGIRYQDRERHQEARDWLASKGVTQPSPELIVVVAAAILYGETKQTARTTPSDTPALDVIAIRMAHIEFRDPEPVKQPKRTRKYKGEEKSA